MLSESGADECCIYAGVSYNLVGARADADAETFSPEVCGAPKA